MVYVFLKDLEYIIREVDIVVVVAGVFNFVCGSWLKFGVVVIDVGICFVEVKRNKN